jgi:hypothetical protein
MKLAMQSASQNRGNKMKLATFTVYQTNAPIHVHPSELAGFTPEFTPGAKPEDKPKSILIMMRSGTEFSVTESYGQVVHIFREHKLEI